jgi:hypothetical protein
LELTDSACIIAWAELGTFDENNIGIVGYAAQFDRTASDRAAAPGNGVTMR